MSSRRFRVLLVAIDRKMLRSLSKFLQVFGYEVQQSADTKQAAAALQGDRPDFLIVDSQIDTGWGLRFCRSVCAQRQTQQMYTLLIARDATPEIITDALEAGVDDFLAHPIIYGELLSRMRAGVRVMEFERRVTEQSSIDPLTGMTSKAGLLQRLGQISRDAGRQAISCVLLDVDFLGGVNHHFGRVIGDRVIQAVGRALSELSQDVEALAALGSGRFCALHRQLSDSQVVAWAEQARNALAELEIPVADSSIHVTASFGVASFPDGAGSPEQVLERAREALHQAKLSGRNCVARCGQFDGETKEWTELASAGKLFEATRARDVMTPCTLVLRADLPAERAHSLLTYRRLGEAPVVDRKGRLVGFVAAEQLADTRSDERQRTLVRDVMDGNVHCHTENARFNALMDLFTTQPARLVVVVRDERPVGLIHRDRLALLSDPLKTDSFVAAGPYSSSSDYLLVPELCPTASS